MTFLGRGHRRALGTIIVTALLVTVAPPARWASATLPGGNGRILDTRCESQPSGQSCWVRVSNLHRVGSQTLTRGRHVIDTAIAWSPDGRRILFSRWTTRNGFAYRGLFTIDQNGENKTKINDLVGAPAFSPNGRRLAFATDDGVWVSRRDGSRLHRIYNAEKDDQGLDAGIAWSSSGRIAFLSYRDYNLCDSTAESDIWSIRPDGTDLTRVTDNNGPEDGLDASPDGRRLIYTSFRPCPGGHRRLYSVRLDGTDERLVTRDRTEDGTAVHSPDGRYVLMSNRPPEIFTTTGTPVRKVRSFGLWQPVHGNKPGRLELRMNGYGSDDIELTGRIATKVAGIEIVAVLYRRDRGTWQRVGHVRTSTTRRGAWHGLLRDPPANGRCRVVVYVPQTTEHRRIKEVRPFWCPRPNMRP